jgi:hypothetical protein
MAFASRNPRYSSNVSQTIQPCAFCEFYNDSESVESWTLEDEKLYLKHLKISHGLER